MSLAATISSFAGVVLDRPRIVGILNVTPDSFSDGGRHGDATAAIEAGLRMALEGADIIDVGGESTRPGASAVDRKEELRRVLPVVEGLARQGVVVSIDTRNAETMRAAVAAGARIVNDVSALTHDPASLQVVAASSAGVVLMHMRGTPADMAARTDYGDVVGEVVDWLAARVAACGAAGIDRTRIALDPGIGFAKNAAQSVALMRGIGRLQALGLPVMVGASRKSFLAKVAGGETPGQRLGGSLAVALLMAQAGVRLLRVHDVAETAQALRLWAALRPA